MHERHRVLGADVAGAQVGVEDPQGGDDGALAVGAADGSPDVLDDLPFGGVEEGVLAGEGAQDVAALAHG